MLKRTLCQATFTWTLTCDGPLLIADGRYDQKQDMPRDDKGKYPDKVFISRNPKEYVRERLISQQADKLNLDFYVPGTSLRGPFRAQAERIIRSLQPENAAPPFTACDPFDMDADNPKSCSKRLDKAKPTVPYVAACPACKLFGCTGTASRIQFTDANFARGYVSVYRDMIGIDRFTGGVFQGEKDATGGKKSGGANMRFHALEKTTFTTTVTVTNFELWQMGLLAYVFRDFQDGLVPIGFGKTKGFGQVKGEAQNIRLTYPRGKADGKTIQHLGSLVSEEERKCYGMHGAEPAACAGLTLAPAQGLSLYETFEVKDPTAFWAAVAPAFNNFIDAKNREAQS